jgi:hypothetical protein
MVLIEEIDAQNKKAQEAQSGAGGGSAGGRVNSVPRSGGGGRGETVQYVNDGDVD